MFHIYGDFTKNGVFVSDMVDDFERVFIVEKDTKAHFARVTNWYESEKKLDSPKPAIAFFAKDEPFQPIFAKKLEGTFADYFEEDGRCKEQFDTVLEEAKAEFLTF